MAENTKPAPLYSSSHDADDFDALLMRRRAEADLPKMADPNTEADNYGGPE